MMGMMWSRALRSRNVIMTDVGRAERNYINMYML